MGLSEDIDCICQDALASLDRAHDYYSFTKRSWRLIQTAVVRRGQKFRFRNQATNSTVDQREFASKAQLYASSELAEATFQQFVSIFEGFLFDVIRAWMLAYPDALSKRQLTGKEILALPDRDALIDALAAKELQDVFYDRPINWFAYLKERLGIEPTGALEFAEIKATRDILVHARGVANRQYLEKAANLARGVLGDRLQVPEPYLQQSWLLMRTLIAEIGSQAAAKFE